MNTPIGLNIWNVHQENNSLEIVYKFSAYFKTNENSLKNSILTLLFNFLSNIQSFRLKDFPVVSLNSRQSKYSSILHHRYCAILIGYRVPSPVVKHFPRLSKRRRNIYIYIFFFFPWLFRTILPLLPCKSRLSATNKRSTRK